ncbi:hypothetical protein VM636_00395 [Streptomyces sp. SCSIO 75703]|uniref:hypothetical protein n=1 Tax=unclassified Streptomyces TaxID=2593676 RepID=UPI00056BD375|nr:MULTISPECIES: hypothetical protein [unclassified Streptomyces]
MPLTAELPPRVSGARPYPPLGPVATAVLQIVADRRTPVFATVHTSGRRRYGYWRPLDSATGRGGCYVALPTAECDALYATGRIELGEPVTDPSRTTYRVRATEIPTAASARAAQRWAHAA